MTEATSAPQAPQPGTETTLFEQIGGEPAVAAVVGIFYDKVMADPDLVGYFQGVDVDQLKIHQRRFIGQALGATRLYSGPSMARAHQDLAITSGAFDRVVGHLAASLAEVGLDQQTISDIAEVVLPLKDDIVTA